MTSILSDEESKEFFTHLMNISKEGLNTTSFVNFYKLLYFVMTNKGEFIEEMFPLYSGKIPKTFSECLESTDDKPVFFEFQKEKANHSHKGRCCSKKIPVGEPIYNCYDCAVDGSCCLCDDCFDKEQHSDHNVLTHFSSGNGICDCGDELSWKVDIHCLADTEENRSELEKPLPQEFQKSIKAITDLCTDVIIDFYYLNTFLTDSYYRKLTSKGDLSEFPKRLSNVLQSHHKFSKYYNCQPSGEYALLIWNDEIHDIYAAKRAIGIALTTLQDVLGGSVLTAEDITQIVDRDGYACLCVSSNLETLVNAYHIIQSRGFYASILDNNLYSFFLITEIITRWISSILEKTADVRILECFRKYFSESLFMPPSQLPIMHPDSNFDDTCFTEDYKDLGLLTKDGLIPRFKGSLLYKHDSIGRLTNFSFKFRSHICEEEGVKGSRIQYLFYLSPRFKKSLRIKLKSILVPVLSTDSKSREMLSDQILDILPSLEYIYLHYDKEWQLSFLDEFKLQIYYDPHIMTHLLDNGTVKDVLSSLVEILHSFSASSPYKYKIVPQEMNEIDSKRKVDSLSSIMKSFTSLFCQIKRGDTRIFELKYFIYLLAIFNYFQESFVVKRKTGAHVEQSSITYTLHYTNAVQLEKIACGLGEVVSTLTEKSKALDTAIVVLINFIEELQKQHNSVFDIDQRVFSISEDGVSYLLPLHSMLAHILRNYKHFDYTLLNEEFKEAAIGLDEVQTVSKPENCKDILWLSFGALNTFALSAQIDSGFWVRNGEEIYHQFQYNLGNFNTMGNLLLCQLSYASVDPDISLSTIVERFGLTPLIFGDENIDSTKFEDHIYNVIDHLIMFFYHVLTFREHFDRNISFDEFKCLELKHELCYKLLKEPKKYSQLAKIRQLYDLDDQFDSILNDIADYLPPRGGNDFGKYCLKKACYSSLDYLSFFARFEPYDDLENFLLDNLKSKKNDDEVPVIQPVIHEVSGEAGTKFKKIFEIYKQPKFVKMIYKLFKFVEETGNEDYLDHLLHLLHAIFLGTDSEKDEDFFSYVDIPIGILLFGIIEKEDMNKVIVKKAKVVLDLLLLKDDGVLDSLVSCFGETHIQEYKKTIKGSGFETKKEKNRRLALKRQQKILKKMNNQQQQFMQKNKTFFKEEIEKSQKSEETKSSSYGNHNVDELRTCIICKNPENSEELFGVPGYVSGCSTFRTISDDPVPVVMRDRDLDSKFIYETYIQKSNKRKLSDQYEVHNYPFSGEAQTVTPPPPPSGVSHHSAGGAPSTSSSHSNQFKRRVITGCSHGMHFSCLQKRVGNNGLHMFECPLCKNYYNFFVPSFRFTGNSTAYLMDGETDNKLKTILKNYSGDNSSALLSTIFEKTAYLNISNPESDFFKTVQSQINPILEGYLFAENGYSSVYSPNLIAASKVSIARLIGDTIELYEIASRYDEQDMREFGDVIGPISLEVLRSLIQFEVLLHFMDSSDAVEYQYSIEKIFRNNSGFLADILPLFFSGSDSIQSISRVMLAKYTSKSLIGLAYKDLRNMSNESLRLICEDPIIKDEEIPTELIEKTRLYLRNVHGALSSQYVDEVEKSLYSAEKVKKFYKILKFLYYRFVSQIELLQYVFNGLSDEFMVLNEGSFRPGYAFNSYLLSLPSFDELLTNMRFSYHSLEYEVASVYANSNSSTLVDARENNLLVEYPKRVALLNLPEKISSFLSIFPLTKASEKKVLCLQCGALLNKDKKHVTSCIGENDGYHILFSPYNNAMELTGSSENFGQLVHGFTTRISTPLESPYLNKHGEVAGGYIGMGGSGILSKTRIDYINKKWLTQSIGSSYFTALGRYKLNSRRDRERGFQFQPTREAFTVFQNLLGEMNRGGVNLDIGIIRNDEDDEENDEDFDDEEFNEVGGIPFAVDDSGFEESDSEIDFEFV